jgi:glycosyltransferase involved in cell wall biosynthesis
LTEPNIETGPLPVLEAMACGVPVISTPVGWAKDHATHNEDIVFIEEDDLFRLPEVIKMVWDNTLARVKIRNNALKLISGFSIEKYCKTLMEIYHEN